MLVSLFLEWSKCTFVFLIVFLIVRTALVYWEIFLTIIVLFLIFFVYIILMSALRLRLVLKLMRCVELSLKFTLQLLLLQHFFCIDLSYVRYITLNSSSKVLSSKNILRNPLLNLDVPLIEHHFEPRNPENHVNQQYEEEQNDCDWEMQIAADEEETTIECCKLKWINIYSDLQLQCLL